MQFESINCWRSGNKCVRAPQVFLYSVGCPFLCVQRAVEIKELLEACAVSIAVGYCRFRWSLPLMETCPFYHVLHNNKRKNKNKDKKIPLFFKHTFVLVQTLSAARFISLFYFLSCRPLFLGVFVFLQYQLPFLLNAAVPPREREVNWLHIRYGEKKKKSLCCV